jgi:hypothetical protein
VIVEDLNLFMIPQQIETRAILHNNGEEKRLLSLLSYEPRHFTRRHSQQ